MNFTKTFHYISQHDAAIAGGKGASLGEMTQTGIPVPPGFVVLAGSFDQFLQESAIKSDIATILEKVNHQDINSVDGAAVEIQAMILNAPFPTNIAKEITHQFHALGAEYVAVRSSATAEDSSAASWAGELETYLNVTEENLLESVKKCWASLFTPRAIFYRFERQSHITQVSVAVVVQKMIQSEVSGICFTVHPVTEDHNQMIIEAGWGLGEAIVGGKITPDSYIINKKDNTITERYISEQAMRIIRGSTGTEENDVPEGKQAKQKLSDENILKLAGICQRIETHYGYPQDIEWAMADSRLYITQSRPITTLKT